MDQGAWKNLWVRKILGLNFLSVFKTLIFLLRIYEGHRPVLITSDLEIIQEVFIKQFNNFSARRVSLKRTDDE